ncbi:DUF4258 domain-containing protein [Fibrobacterota bacterium]
MDYQGKKERREKLLNRYYITSHANRRMSLRGVSQRAIQAALQFGRVVHTRGAEIYAIRKKEVLKFKDYLDPKWEGLHVVCTPHGNAVMTAYKNKNFSRSLRA